MCFCVGITVLGVSLTSQGNVAMEEASLEDEAQYTGAAHPLLLPSWHRAETRASYVSVQLHLR